MELIRLSTTSPFQPIHQQDNSNIIGQEHHQHFCTSQSPPPFNNANIFSGILTADDGGDDYGTDNTAPSSLNNTTKQEQLLSQNIRNVRVGLSPSEFLKEEDEEEDDDWVIVKNDSKCKPNEFMKKKDDDDDDGSGEGGGGDRNGGNDDKDGGGDEDTVNKPFFPSLTTNEQQQNHQQNDSSYDLNLQDIPRKNSFFAENFVINKRKCSKLPSQEDSCDDLVAPKDVQKEEDAFCFETHTETTNESFVELKIGSASERLPNEELHDSCATIQRQQCIDQLKDNPNTAFNNVIHVETHRESVSSSVHSEHRKAETSTSSDTSIGADQTILAATYNLNKGTVSGLIASDDVKKNEVSLREENFSSTEDEVFYQDQQQRNKKYEKSEDEDVDEELNNERVFECNYNDKAAYRDEYDDYEEVKRHDNKDLLMRENSGDSGGNFINVDMNRSLSAAYDDGGDYDDDDDDYVDDDHGRVVDDDDDDVIRAANMIINPDNLDEKYIEFKKRDFDDQTDEDGDEDDEDDNGVESYNGGDDGAVKGLPQVVMEFMDELEMEKDSRGHEMWDDGMKTVYRRKDGEVDEITKEEKNANDFFGKSVDTLKKISMVLDDEDNEDDEDDDVDGEKMDGLVRSDSFEEVSSQDLEDWKGSGGFNYNVATIKRSKKKQTPQNIDNSEKSTQQNSMYTENFSGDHSVSSSTSAKVMTSPKNMTSSSNLASPDDNSSLDSFATVRGCHGNLVSSLHSSTHSDSAFSPGKTLVSAESGGDEKIAKTKEEEEEEEDELHDYYIEQTAEEKVAESSSIEPNAASNEFWVEDESLRDERERDEVVRVEVVGGRVVEERGYCETVLSTIKEEEERMSSMSGKTSSSSNAKQQKQQLQARKQPQSDTASVSSSLQEFERLEKEMQDCKNSNGSDQKRNSNAATSDNSSNNSNDAVADNISISSSLAEFEQLEDEFKGHKKENEASKQTGSNTSLNSFEMEEQKAALWFQQNQDLISFNQSQPSTTTTATTYPEYQDVVQLIRNSAEFAEKTEILQKQPPPQPTPLPQQTLQTQHTPPDMTLSNESGAFTQSNSSGFPMDDSLLMTSIKMENEEGLEMDV